jgi:hypothetical protein
MSMTAVTVATRTGDWGVTSQASATREAPAQAELRPPPGPGTYQERVIAIAFHRQDQPTNMHCSAL